MLPYRIIYVQFSCLSASPSTRLSLAKLTGTPHWLAKQPAWIYTWDALVLLQSGPSLRTGNNGSFSSSFLVRQLDSTRQTKEKKRVKKKNAVVSNASATQTTEQRSQDSSSLLWEAVKCVPTNIASNNSKYVSKQASSQRQSPSNPCTKSASRYYHDMDVKIWRMGE